MILGRDLLTELGLNIKFSKHIINSDDGPLIGDMAPMVDLAAYTFKYLNAGGIKPEELFTDAYAEEVYESAHVRSATKQLCVILYAKYKKSDLHKVMKLRVKF